MCFCRNHVLTPTWFARSTGTWASLLSPAPQSHLTPTPGSSPHVCAHSHIYVCTLALTLTHTCPPLLSALVTSPPSLCTPSSATPQPRAFQQERPSQPLLESGCPGTMLLWFWSPQPRWCCPPWLGGELLFSSPRRVTMHPVPAAVA